MTDFVHSVEMGSGMPLVMLHGFGVDHRLLMPLDPTIDANGSWRRIYVDLPGMGQSGAGPHIDGADAVLESVAEFIRANLGTQRFALLGNSFGGMIARGLIAEFGPQLVGLCLLCPVIVAEHARRVIPDRIILHNDPAFLETLPVADADEYASMAVIQSSENWDRFRSYALPGLRCADPAAISRISNNYALHSALEGETGTFARPY